MPPSRPPVFEPASAGAGQQFIAGPAVIEQLDATTLVFPGDRVTRRRRRNLLIELTS